MPPAITAAVGEVALDQLAADALRARRPWPGCGPEPRTSSPRSRSWRDDVTADESGAAGEEDLHRRASLPYHLPHDRRALHGRHGREPPTEPSRRASATRGRVSARWRSASLPGKPGEDAELDELAELLRTAGVATAGSVIQQRAEPDPDRYLGRGKLDEVAGRDQARRRQPRRLRRRARAAPGAQPRGGARRAGDRPHRRDPRHLRRPRPQRRGQAPGRARPARVQPRAHAGPVDPPRAPRRRPHGRRHRHQGPGRVPDRDRPPARPRPDRGAAPRAAGRRAEPRDDARASASARAIPTVALAGYTNAGQVDAAERDHRAPASGSATASSTRSTRPRAPSSTTAAATC